jgi:hypothetical protein
MAEALYAEPTTTDRIPACQSLMPERGWDTVDDPTIIDPTDAVVRIDTSTICGTDLHILKGDVPETTAGTVLGHELIAVRGREELDRPTERGATPDVESLSEAL